MRLLPVIFLQLSAKPGLTQSTSDNNKLVPPSSPVPEVTTPREYVECYFQLLEDYFDVDLNATAATAR